MEQYNPNHNAISNTAEETARLLAERRAKQMLRRHTCASFKSDQLTSGAPIRHHQLPSFKCTLEEPEEEEDDKGTNNVMVMVIKINNGYGNTFLFQMAAPSSAALPPLPRPSVAPSPLSLPIVPSKTSVPLDDWGVGSFTSVPSIAPAFHSTTGQHIGMFHFNPVVNCNHGRRPVLIS